MPQGTITTTLSFESVDTNAYTIQCELKIKYAEIYKKGRSRNDYNKLNVCNRSAGIYFFVDPNNTVIYVGESHDRCLYARVTQHFNEDHGGLRYKLKKANRLDLISKLEDATLYVYPLPNADKSEILYAESYFIGIYKPEFNFVISDV